MHLIPLDASRACAFYCCTALEPQAQMSFNEGFCIPVPANALAVCALQLSVCSLGPQAQEELLVGLKRRISFMETEAGPVNDTESQRMLDNMDALTSE